MTEAEEFLNKWLLGGGTVLMLAERYLQVSSLLESATNKIYELQVEENNRLKEAARFFSSLPENAFRLDHSSSIGMIGLEPIHFVFDTRSVFQSGFLLEKIVEEAAKGLSHCLADQILSRLREYRRYHLDEWGEVRAERSDGR